MRVGFCIRTGSVPARSPRPLYGSPVPVKVVRKFEIGAARRFSLVAAPPLTGTGEPKTWLVRLLRREFWPEFFRIRF